MLKRYDITKDEMIELTQKYFDDHVKQCTAMALHYKENSPENFKNFYDNYVFTNKV